MKEILKNTYDILEAEDAKSAMDGFQVLEELNMECKSESRLRISLTMCYNKGIDMKFWSGIYLQSGKEETKDGYFLFK